MTRSRRHFTDEFKREAVRLTEQPCSNVSQVARDLGLDPSVLRQGAGQGQDRAGHIKKSGRILCQGPDMKYPFNSRHRTVWSVSDLYLALAVSRSGFYEWHGRSPSARQCANERLISRIRESFQANDCTYWQPPNMA